MTQLTLSNKKISEEQLIPITMEIEFSVKDESLWWNGKAYPKVSSGCSFGGVISYKNKKQIDEIVTSQKRWFKESYGRPIKEKITINDLINKQKSLKK